jgi:hypothetical protein
LLLRLRVATAEDNPELAGLAMQIGEHLAQFLRFGRHLSRQCHAPRRGSLLQHFRNAARSSGDSLPSASIAA